VNDLAKEIMKLKKENEDPIPKAKKMIKDALRFLIHELEEANNKYRGLEDRTE